MRRSGVLRILGFISLILSCIIRRLKADEPLMKSDRPKRSSPLTDKCSERYAINVPRVIRSNFSIVQLCIYSRPLRTIVRCVNFKFLTIHLAESTACASQWATLRRSIFDSGSSRTRCPVAA